jgi:hypothetical protein
MVATFSYATYAAYFAAILVLWSVARFSKSRTGDATAGV